MRHIIPISGKDSLATALVQLRRQPELSYEYVFNPTGAELPEVFAWLEAVEVYLGAPIVRVGANLEEIIEDYGYFLPNHQSRYCTKEAKIWPFEKWIGKNEPATVYYGIRADEDRGGYKSNKYPNILPAYPLKEEGVDMQGVYQIINAAGLKPPTFFWKAVYDAVVIVVGQKLIDELPEWMRDMLFAGRSRANCYYCYQQRLYEWVYLHDTHPPLFWNAESMEHKGSEYTWNGNGHSLQSIVGRADEIRSKRVKAIIKIIREMRDSKVKQRGLFDINPEDSVSRFFSQASCGLFCAK